MRRRSTTGPASISALTPAAPSAATTVSTASCSAITTPDSSAASRLGADYQFAGVFVVGVEGQYSWLSSNRIPSIFPTGFVYSNNQRGLGSITGRLGYSWGPALFYAKGGYAYSSHSETLTLGGAPIAFTLDRNHRDGYTVGAGVEYLFTPNWSAKAEYQYYDFGSSRFIAPAPLVPFGTFSNVEHTLKAGVNYRFNLGGSTAARY